MDIIQFNYYLFYLNMNNIFKELWIEIHKEDDWSYYAEVKALPWCFTMWENLEELSINLKEAITSYLLSMQKDIKKFDFELQINKKHYA